MACSVLVQVGTVDGRGYNGHQVDAICDACGPCQMIQSTFKPVFLLIQTDWIRLRITQMPRYQDLEISVATTDGQTDRQMDRQTDYFTPGYASGAIIPWVTW